MQEKAICLLETDHYLLETGYFLSETRHFLLETGHFLLETDHFLSETSHFLLEKAIFLLETEHFLLEKVIYLLEKGHFLLEIGHFLQEKVFLYASFILGLPFVQNESRFLIRWSGYYMGLLKGLPTRYYTQGVQDLNFNPTLMGKMSKG